MTHAHQPGRDALHETLLHGTHSHEHHTGTLPITNTTTQANHNLLKIATALLGTAAVLAPMLAPTYRTATFLLNAAALLPLSEQMAEATLELAHYAGTVGGALICASFGNLVELVVSVLALRKNMVRFVQVTLLGSTLFGAMLLPACCFIAAAAHPSAVRKNVRMHKHNKHAAGIHTMILVLAAFSYCLPSAYNATMQSEEARACRGQFCILPQVLPLSRGVALVLLPCYCALLYWSTVTHCQLLQKKKTGEQAHTVHEQLALDLAGMESDSDAEAADEMVPALQLQLSRGSERRRDAAALSAPATDGGGASDASQGGSLLRSVAFTAFLAAWIGLCAEHLLSTVDSAADCLGLTRHFVALVVVPFVGNIDTFVAAFKVASTGNVDLALALGIGAAVQVATGIVPLLVVGCWFVGIPLHLDLRPFETIVLLLSTQVATEVVRRARSTFLEGAFLLGAYAMVGLAYLFRSQEEASLGEGDAVCVCGTACCESSQNSSTLAGLAVAAIRARPRH